MVGSTHPQMVGLGRHLGLKIADPKKSDGESVNHHFTQKKLYLGVYPIFRQSRLQLCHNQIRIFHRR
jgi:hypothetical protein